MAEEEQIQTYNSDNKTKKPFLSLQVYRRKIRPKSDHSLPEELVIEILKRIPVSSLLRFMCVCKSWYSLIKNPSFISAHLSHQSDPTSKNGISTIYSVPFQFFLHNVDEALDNWVEIDSPVGYVNLIVGCCHGVICLYDYWSRGFSPLVLWNPSIRKAFTLPFPVSKTAFSGTDFTVVDEGFGKYVLPNFTLGFGFDPISKEYKVVRVFYNWESGSRVTYLQADVCSLSKGDWRTVHSSVEGGKFVIKCRGVYVNGVIHWMCKKKLGNNVFVKTVLAFNLANEKFSQILLPSPLSSAVLLSVKVVEDKLAVSCTGDASNVWVMEEYGMAKSWRKLLNFHIGDNVGTVLGARVAKDGKIVVTTSVGNWISWDPSNEKLENLALPVLEPDYVDTYVRSLVLLGFKNQALRCRKLPLKKKVRKRLTAHKYRSYLSMLQLIRSEDFRN
ncbi:F-box/kelch-repeat protein At3g23880 isoform X1 [Beta vulgaris subsp. vulgaris]|uniref:F-box/kelch-repeat protein At3g23880 isoform X1 n=1 Tax=Beta vulgaris subsp. vulgaris TaxID=3555 RepID=UPI002036ED88|nr:F-box/kelch-repeat protein At3g23880 isoform X1 [Beta vulgaris subsp. vulgaris]